jgi:hypothetical protein
MTATQERTHRFVFRTFMLKHQYKVMGVSLVIGFMWVGIYHLLASSWFFSRLSLLFAVISFVPTGLVILVHGRELGPFMWWDKRNVVLTTRRSPKLERLELTVMAVLWGIIFIFVVVVIFVLSRP